MSRSEPLHNGAVVNAFSVGYLLDVNHAQSTIIDALYMHPHRYKTGRREHRLTDTSRKNGPEERSGVAMREIYEL